MADLLPCPFCGGVEWSVINGGTTVLLHHVARGKASRYQAVCQNKKCDTKPKTAIHGIREDALKAWNTRSPAVLGIDLVVPPNADETK